MKTYLKPLLLLLLLSSGAAIAQNPEARLITTFPNPTGDASDGYGSPVAALGSDRVLVGTGSANKAYLFSLNGGLLTTFSVSDPKVGGFGAALATVGDDRVLIGAYNYSEGVFPNQDQNGRAYLFSTNGTLLTTFTNPSPVRVQAFGWAVAALGSDRVLVSGLTGNNGAPYLSAAYLFRTNGSLLTTFTNPNSTIDGGFGVSVAAVGDSQVIIGDDFGAGAAYLYSSNGALLRTFTNPAPVVARNFGWALAAVSNDQVLISAFGDSGEASGGAAYLFSTNGALLTTFSNPTPAASDYFGYVVAAVGSSRVLIGAYQDGAGAFRSGSAYLFSTNGTLLNTINNPAPRAYGSFGSTVAAMGKDHVIIGAGNVSYLFALPYPPLSISRNGSDVSLSWITAEAGITVQQTDLLGLPTGWSDTTDPVSINGQTNVVQQTMAITNRFFRLRRP